jgi:hypothetical protein
MLFCSSCVADGASAAAGRGNAQPSSPPPLLLLPPLPPSNLPPSRLHLAAPASTIYQKGSALLRKCCSVIRMSHPLQFGLDGACPDLEEDVADTRADIRDFPGDTSEGSLGTHTDSEAEESEPADVRSFSHSYVLQAALQKNQSDPYFNPAHSKIKQPANVLHEPPVSSLGGIAACAVAADDQTPSDSGSVYGMVKPDQPRHDDATTMPSLSDENITAGRWIGLACLLLSPAMCSARDSYFSQAMP